MSHPSSTWSLLGTVTDANPSGAGSVVPGVDLQLDSEGDLLVDYDAHLTTGLTAVAQGISIRLQLVRGEWALDLDLGVPYFERDGVLAADAIMGQKFSDLKARAAFRSVIEGAPHVDALEQLTIEFDRATRELSVGWRAITMFGVVEGSAVV